MINHNVIIDVKNKTIREFDKELTESEINEIEKSNEIMNKNKKIIENKNRLDELNKDFIQCFLGAKIENIELKKQEFIRLHNEIRVLEGKSPRQYDI